MTFTISGHSVFRKSSKVFAQEVMELQAALDAAEAVRDAAHITALDAQTSVAALRRELDELQQSLVMYPAQVHDLGFMCQGLIPEYHDPSNIGFGRTTVIC